MIKSQLIKMLGGIILLALFLGQSPAKDNTVKYDFADSEKWHRAYKKTEIVDYKGKQALRIIPGIGTGVVYLKDFNFKNGIIELYIAAIPSFTGLIFRVKDNDTYEGIYFRPQNSRHADPDKRLKTVQYISHPKHPWHLLRKNFPGKYEGPVDLPPDEWFHVKVEVKNLKASVYVNHSEKPCLVVTDLKHGICEGSVGVWTGNTSGGTFTNFQVTRFKE